MLKDTIVYADERLSAYNFGERHPFGPKRYYAFEKEFMAQKLTSKVDIGQVVSADRAVIERFHTSEYVNHVIEASKEGLGFLDDGDTPAFKDVYNISSQVTGSVIDAVDRLMKGENQRAFIPIAGLHHANRDGAAGFCVFNDCGIAIETLRKRYKLQRVAYVDIDAHHGDGVFYSFERDPNLIFADIHEDGDFLFPGTGFADETGKGDAIGTKLNISMNPEAGDSDFYAAWEKVESYLHAAKPQFVIFQCGADSLKGDPITHLAYSEKAYAHAAKSLCLIADKYAKGRIIGLGGGGYNLDNIAQGWNAVVNAFVQPH